MVAPPGPHPYLVPPSHRAVPPGVAALAGLAVVTGLCYLLIGAGVICVGGIIGFIGRLVVVPWLPKIVGLVLGIGLAIAAVGFLYFVDAWRLMELLPQARRDTILTAVAGLGLGVLQLLIGSATGILGLILNILIIYYLTRPEVKAAFAPMPDAVAPMPVRRGG